MDLLGKFVAWTAILATTVFVRGLVIQIMWAWFVVPLGVPAIEIAHALGLSVLIVWLCKDMSRETKKPEMASYLGRGVFFPLVALGIGGVCHAFM